MATDFGFLPAADGIHYFISYNTEDTDRVRSIALAMHRSGVPLWYDYGLEYGKEWEKQIAAHIHSAKAVIMFITAGMFRKEKSYVRKEYEIAELYGIRVIPVILDSIDQRSIPEHSIGWWIDIRALHSVQLSAGDTAESLSMRIMHALGLAHKSAADSPAPHSSASCAQTVPLSAAVKVGDHVKFGRYRQNGDSPEPIEWRVLDIIDGKALMISENLLDCRKYNEQVEDVTWETCTLRRWLNGEFINTAFGAEERQKLRKVRIPNHDNPTYGTKGGSPTEDYVFCLSIDEAGKYFDSDESRKAIPSALARKNGCFVSPKFDTGWWWLRSSGLSASRSAYVYAFGSIYEFGNYVNFDHSCVRPVVLVQI